MSQDIELASQEPRAAAAPEEAAAAVPAAAKHRRADSHACFSSSSDESSPASDGSGSWHILHAGRSKRAGGKCGMIPRVPGYPHPGPPTRRVPGPGQSEPLKTGPGTRECRAIERESPSPMAAGKGPPPALPSRRPTAPARDNAPPQPPTNRGRTAPDLPPRRHTVANNVAPVHAGQAAPELPPRRHTVEARDAPSVHADRAPPPLPARGKALSGSAPPMDEDHEPARAPVVRRVLAGSAPPPMDEECDREPPVVPPERKTAVAQSAAPKGTANVPPPDLPVRQPRVQQQSAPTPKDARKVPQAKDARKVPRAKGAREVPQAKGAREVPQATDAGEVPQAKGVREVPQAKYAGKVPQAKDQGNVPPAVPVRPDPVPSSAARAPRNSEGGNAPRNGHGPAADGARQSEPAQPPPPGYAEVTGDKKGRFSMDGGIAGMVRGVVGKKSSEGKDSDEDEVSELEKKRDKLQYVEYAVNAADYAREFEGYANMAEQGAAVVEEGARMTQEAAEVANVDLNQVGAAAQELSAAPEVAGATAGAAATMEQMAAAEIVEGHKYHSCIDDTCLEGIVECVAENCAIPLYKFMGQTCCRICCSEGAAENVDNARTVAGHTESAAEGAKEGFGQAEGCFSSICGCFDMCECCLADEALAYALPFCGLIFSLFRLYQGSTLSLRSMVGMCSGVDRRGKLGFRWMMAEAPGLIIVTLPSILACSLVARKARKNRLTLHKKEEPEEEEAIDPETGERMAVVTAQPIGSPTREDTKFFYDQAYQAVRGRLKTADQNVPEEILTSDLIPEGGYPAAPRGQWSSGPFDCAQHIPSCVTSFCCGCITVGQVAEGARLFSHVFYVSVVVYLFETFCSAGFGGWLWILFATYAVAVSRARVAEEYDIPINTLGNWWPAISLPGVSTTVSARDGASVVPSQ
eukprot:jgi/Undpi1/5696/HiC_scaffold_2.g00970.m1